MKRNLITETCLALLILLFAYTSLSKLLEMRKFIFQMQLAPLPLMKQAAPLLGWLLPLLEALIVAGLLLPRFRIGALYASAGLLLLFECYIAGMLLSGHQLPCTCGGIISRMSWQTHLLFNAAFIGIALKALYDLLRIKQVVPLPEKNGQF